MRALLFILAAFAAAYAIVSGVSGLPIHAGLGVTVTMAAWLVADIVGYRQRERLRQARELVWARREREQTTMTHTHEAGRTR
jgi:antitoxin (DNA-binding transcriptional repressor) of toxin-antitoxin stability system